MSFDTQNWAHLSKVNKNTSKFARNDDWGKKDFLTREKSRKSRFLLHINMHKKFDLIFDHLGPINHKIFGLVKDEKRVSNVSKNNVWTVTIIPKRSFFAPFLSDPISVFFSTEKSSYPTKLYSIHSNQKILFKFAVKSTEDLYIKMENGHFHGGMFIFLILLLTFTSFVKFIVHWD